MFTYRHILLFANILMFAGIFARTVDINNNIDSKIVKKSENFLIQDSTLSPLDEKLSNKIKSCLHKANIKDKNIIISRLDNFDINKYDGNKVTYFNEPILLSQLQKMGHIAGITTLSNSDKFNGLQDYYLFFVHQSYLEYLSEQEQDAIIYHEIGHIKKNHKDRMFKYNIGSGLSVLALFALYEYKIRQVRSSGLKILGRVLVYPTILVTWEAFLMYRSRKDEYEADAYSFEHTKDAKPFQNFLKRFDRPMTFIQKLFRSHPTSQQRIEALEKLSKNDAKSSVN